MEDLCEAVLWERPMRPIPDILRDLEKRSRARHIVPILNSSDSNATNLDWRMERLNSIALKTRLIGDFIGMMRRGIQVNFNWNPLLLMRPYNL